MKPIFITRSDIGWYSKNANVYRKALEVASMPNALLCVSTACRVPPEIEAKASQIIRFHSVRELVKSLPKAQGLSRETRLYTGFDFPSLHVAATLKRRHHCHWTLFCWDPPCLQYRDRLPLLRRGIDLCFQHYINLCDRLVLNIHPGLLLEVGYRGSDLQKWRISGKLEERLQDAFEGLAVGEVEPLPSPDYEIGVLSNWSYAKGAPLVMAALERLEGVRCLWIGDPPPQGAIPQSLAERVIRPGRLSQEEAFEKLSRCRVLLAPYLPVPSLKWNYALKIFEYLQLKRPILASDNPGTVAIAQKFPGRLVLFKSGDVNALVQKLTDMV